MAKKGTDMLLYLAAGFFGGMAFDYMSFAYPGFPGAEDVRTSDPQLTMSDIFQLGAESLITVVGFMTGSDGLAMAGFGAQQGALYSKIIAPMTGLPRYIMVDSPAGTAVLTPVGTTPQQAAKLKTGQKVGKAKYGEYI